MVELFQENVYCELDDCGGYCELNDYGGTVSGEGERCSGNLDRLAIPLRRCQTTGKVQVFNKVKDIQRQFASSYTGYDMQLAFNLLSTWYFS